MDHVFLTADKDRKGNEKPITNLLTCITFHYVESRLPCLRKVLQAQPALGNKTTVRIITNTHKADETKKIAGCFDTPSNGAFTWKIVSANALPHPHLLTWEHKLFLRDEFANNHEYSHFMYLEDDILIQSENLKYWMTAREMLRPYGLIPSFLRVEHKELNPVWRTSDLTYKVVPRFLPRAVISEELWFVNLPNPYQGMYFFDRELAREHLSGPACSKSYIGGGGIRENAAIGQTHLNVPMGFSARNAVPYDVKGNRIPSACWIHHLANNYANNPDSLAGKLAVDNELIFAPPLEPVLPAFLKRNVMLLWLQYQLYYTKHRLRKKIRRLKKKTGQSLEIFSHMKLCGAGGGGLLFALGKSHSSASVCA